MQLLPGSVTLGALGVDFKDSIQPLALEVSWFSAGMERKSDVALRVPIGELVQPLSMSEEDFVSEQGKRHVNAFINIVILTTYQYI